MGMSIICACTENWRGTSDNGRGRVKIERSVPVAAPKTTEQKQTVQNKAAQKFRMAALGAGILLALFAAAHTGPHFILNTSKSVPRGLYLVQKKRPEKGDLAAFTLPFDAGRLAAGTVFLKRAAAKEGESCLFAKDALRIGGKTFERKEAGRIFALPEGQLTVPPGSCIFLGDSPDSFDSRYFGPVRERYVIGRCVPLVTVK